MQLLFCIPVNLKYMLGLLWEKIFLLLILHGRIQLYTFILRGTDIIPPRTKSPTDKIPPEKVTPDRIPPHTHIFFTWVLIYNLLGLYIKKLSHVKAGHINAKMFHENLWSLQDVS